MNAAALDEIDVRVRNLFLSAKEVGVKLAAKSIAKSREVVDFKARSLASFADRLGAVHDSLVAKEDVANENAAAASASASGAGDEGATSSIPPSRL